MQDPAQSVVIHLPFAPEREAPTGKHSLSRLQASKQKIQLQLERNPAHLRPFANIFAPRVDALLGPCVVKDVRLERGLPARVQISVVSYFFK